MFDGFALERIDCGEADLRVRHGGEGPPLVLLHGHPRTHTTWHRVAPRLAARFTVVCPDLRGYGASSKPPTTADHEPDSNRAVAPLLAGRHTVVCPDLRGYGESSGPPTTPDHAPYSKRAMARDVVVDDAPRA